MKLIAMSALAALVVLPVVTLAAEPSPGEKFRDCPECPEMVTVPAGSFMMGTPEFSDEDWVANESPEHEVTIARPFAVGVYEVTRGEFARFVLETGYRLGSNFRQGFGVPASRRTPRAPSAGSKASPPALTGCHGRRCRFPEAQDGCEHDAARRHGHDVSCATGTGAWWPKANARYNVSQSGSR